MHVDDNEPTQSLMDSFQRVLDDLDAARAELHAMDPRATGSRAPGPRAPGPRATVPRAPRAGSPPPYVTVEPLWARGAPPTVQPRLALKRGRWAGVCGVGAVGGLIVASTVLTSGALAPGESAPAARPDRPPHQGAWGSDGEDAGERREVPRRTYRIPRLHPGGRSSGHYDIEVRAAAARFQDPSDLVPVRTEQHGPGARTGPTSKPERTR
ncbi:hypothetical protein AMK26_31305 [Streptomyces sp. CB03234]|uniref:hypothetical protein n=1 Tax=Streptomyces sp. (strain CB03234) TaxID=1703937 RepID=UPI00093C4953|nr:hypothetical protein [Streptomyces sp. CB03234]OKJ95089.1 hypothetical protein AMK26_31305 [Streptomyces sp. CB03234]